MSNEDLLRPRSAAKLTATEHATFKAALELVQQHLGEIRELGYTGPAPASYNSEAGTLFDEQVGIVWFRFPQWIEGPRPLLPNGAANRFFCLPGAGNLCLGKPMPKSALPIPSLMNCYMCGPPQQMTLPFTLKMT